MNVIDTAEHIFARRQVYSHHGLYVGNNHVIHFYKEHNSKFDGKIIKTSLSAFAQEDELYRVVYRKILPASESIQNAYGKLEESEYNLLFNNCEHFATWCKTGKSQSKQVEAVRNIMLSLIPPFQILTPIVAVKGIFDYAYIVNIERFN